MLKALAAAAALLWAGSDQAAAIELTLKANLTSTWFDPDPSIPPVVSGPTEAEITLAGDNWADRFYISGNEPSACFAVQSGWNMGCLVPTLNGNQVSFNAPELGGWYQGLSILLTFSENVELDPNLISPETFVGGSYGWFYAHNNGSMITSGGLSWLHLPEPSTWAMMLIGFGAVGTAMRRRTRAAHHATSVA